MLDWKTIITNRPNKFSLERWQCITSISGFWTSNH